MRRILGLLAIMVFAASLHADCTYALSAAGQGFSAEGGKGSVDITTTPACTWSASGLPTWVTEATSGIGNGTLTYQVAVNSGPDRSATITVGDASFTIEQETTSIVGLISIGSMPHIAAEGGWTTAFTLVNKGASALARLSLFGDATDASGNGPLAVPLAFPQQPAASSPVLAATLDRAISTNASLVIDTAGPQTSPVLVGSAQLAVHGRRGRLRNFSADLNCAGSRRADGNPQRELLSAGLRQHQRRGDGRGGGERFGAARQHWSRDSRRQGQRRSAPLEP